MRSRRALEKSATRLFRQEGRSRYDCFAVALRRLETLGDTAIDVIRPLPYLPFGLQPTILPNAAAKHGLTRWRLQQRCHRSLICRLFR